MVRIASHWPLEIMCRTCGDGTMSISNYTRNRLRSCTNSTTTTFSCLYHSAAQHLCSNEGDALSHNGVHPQGFGHAPDIVRKSSHSIPKRCFVTREKLEKLWKHRGTAACASVLLKSADGSDQLGVRGEYIGHRRDEARRILHLASSWMHRTDGAAGCISSQEAQQALRRDACRP